MDTLIKVSRYHLANRMQYIVLPCAVTAFTFVVNLILFTALPRPSGGSHTGALVTIYIFFFIVGVTSINRSLPFGMALGLSRRTYFMGTILLAVGLATAYGLALALLETVERASGGWGMAMYYFRVGWILSGSWYMTWMTSLVLLLLSFGYGLWFGLVYRRWNLVGLVVCIVAQVTVILVATLVATWAHAWSRLGHFFTALSPGGVTAVLVAVVMGLVLCGYITLRGVAV